MEDALLESRQIFADIISFLPDPTFVIDAEGKVLAWNRALEQLSGVPAAEIVGKGDYEYSLWMDGKRRPILINLVQDPDKDYGRVDYRGIIEEGHTIMAETDVIHSGKKITLSLVASPLLDQDGKIIGAIESMRDITRIKETEAELARINAHLETLVKERTHALEEEVIQRRNAEQKVKDTLRYTRNVIETNPDLMVILDAEGIIQDVNATSEQMTGLPREKLIGTSYNLYLIANNDAETNFALITIFINRPSCLAGSSISPTWDMSLESLSSIFLPRSTWAISRPLNIIVIFTLSPRFKKSSRFLSLNW